MKKLVILFVALCFVGCCHKSDNVDNAESQYVDSLVHECLRKDSLYCSQSMDSAGNSFDISKDSFVVEYRQKIYGYKVKAVLKPENSERLVFAADIYFSKNGKTFVLHSSCFGDTAFCKGRLDLEHENMKILKKFAHKTIKADYVINPQKERPMLQYVPFFFQDMDFDNMPELVIVHYSMAGRFHNEYDVYRLLEGRPVLIDYPPYNRITDYPEFDYKKKTITCPFPEGEMRYTQRVVYGVSKRKKDVVIVNNRKQYFNKLVMIRTIHYE